MQEFVIRIFNKKTFFVWFFVIITLVIMGSNIYYHEKAHLAINSLYDANTDGKIYFNGNSFYVNVNLTKCNDSCKLANNLNEVVTYNIQGIYLIISIGMIFIIILLSEIKTSCEKKQEIK